MQTVQTSNKKREKKENSLKDRGTGMQAIKRKRKNRRKNIKSRELKSKERQKETHDMKGKESSQKTKDGETQSEEKNGRKEGKRLRTRPFS